MRASARRPRLPTSDRPEDRLQRLRRRAALALLWEAALAAARPRRRRRAAVRRRLLVRPLAVDAAVGAARRAGAVRAGLRRGARPACCGCAGRRAAARWTRLDRDAGGRASPGLGAGGPARQCRRRSRHRGALGAAQGAAGARGRAARRQAAVAARRPRATPTRCASPRCCWRWSASSSAGSERFARLAAAFYGMPTLAHATGARVDAWIDPPAYTGKPPIFLKLGRRRGDPQLAAPEDSVLVVRADPKEVSVSVSGGLVAGRGDAAAGAPVRHPRQRRSENLSGRRPRRRSRAEGRSQDRAEDPSARPAAGQCLGLD